MSSDNTGYAEQIRRIIYDVYGLASFAGPRLDASIESAVTAIAALPAPAGVEVTEDDLADFIDGLGILMVTPISDDDECAEVARALLSRFTILSKPAQEGHGS